MKQSKERLVVTAGLAGALALGAFGCSTKTETTTTVSDGSTTQVTTTETTNGSTTTTETTTTTNNGGNGVTPNLDETKVYNISSIGLHYDLPEGFKFTSLESNIDTSNGTAGAFQAVNSENDNVTLTVTDKDPNLEITDPAFIEQRVKQLSDQFTGQGATIKDTKTDPYEYTAADGTKKTFPCAAFTIEKEGKTSYVKVVFMHDGDHILSLAMSADSEATIDAMLKGLGVDG